VSADLHDGAAVAPRVVDVEGDEVFSLNTGTVLVVDPDVLALKAQLEELTLGDGDLHLSMLTVHLRLDDVIVNCQTHGQTDIKYGTWQCETVFSSR